MKTLISAIALVIASPALAQTAPASQDHAQHQAQGQHAQHQQHGQHQQQGQGGQHQPGQHGCCADRNGNGRPDCCEQTGQAQGQQRACCQQHQAAGHQGH